MYSSLCGLRQRSRGSQVYECIYPQIIQFQTEEICLFHFPFAFPPETALTIGHFNMAQSGCQFNQHFVSVNVLGNFSARGRTIDGPFKRFSTGHHR